MEDKNQLEAARAFSSVFAESFAALLTLKLGTPWLLKVQEDADVVKAAEAAIHFRVSVAGGLQGECFVAFEQAQATQFGSKFLEDADSALSDPQDEALAGVIVAATQGVGSSLAAQFGAVTFKVDRVEDVRVDEMLAVPLAVSSGEKEETSILLYFNEQLLASLSSSNERDPIAKAKKTTIDPANLKLVMDVELNVSLRFGQCQLPLRDVLDLTSGSVIELDRDVDDPVELLLDGKVIARGEAVIIDGNYGLRVTEIPEPIASHFVS
jgi:flagellar motor switch protein FliN